VYEENKKINLILQSISFFL